MEFMLIVSDTLLVDRHKPRILLLKLSLYCINYDRTYYSICFLTHPFFRNLYFNRNSTNDMAFNGLK